jgi:1-acyl-sn-glycerol-3-phosphate acyltransferase
VNTPVLDVLRPAIRAVARAYFGTRFLGVEHIPLQGALIIAPNHVTFADPPLVSIPIRRPVHYMAWDALFRIPVFARVIRRLRAFPVDIESADRGATREAVRLLDAGAAVMIFPEAARTLDGRMQRFRLGAFRLACARKVPVLPVSIAGGYECWPPGRMLPRPGRLTITYHPVVLPPDGADGRAAALAMAAEVRTRIASALPGDHGAGDDGTAATV